MRDEIRGLGDLVDLVAERVTTPVEGMHRAIADRSLRWTGSTGEPARRRVDATIASIYDVIRLGGSAAGATIGLIAAARPGAFSGTEFGRKLQAVANATWGDELEKRNNGFRTRMGVRDPSGAPVALTPAGVAAAFPEAESRVAILVHGLGRTEQSWLAKDDRDGLWDRLNIEPSITPVMVRYNSGRHLSDNGAELAGLLEMLWNSWPIPIESMALVGHSMGGLVIRSACHFARAADRDWVNALDHVVTVASPHLGAPLEKAANIVSWGLRATPESSPLAEFLDARSVGIKDLRFGIISEENWYDSGTDASSAGKPTDPSPVPEVDHHFLAAVVTKNPAHPVGAVLGDLMVRAASGTGRGRRRHVEATHTQVLGGRRHFDLLHDPEVQDQVLEWLDVKKS